MQEYVAVDIGNNHVERLFGCQRGGIAQYYADIVNRVERNVFFRVFHAPFVHVDGHALACAAHSGEDSENARAAAHVEHALAGERLVEQALEHLVSGGVVPRAKRHLRVNRDAIVGLGHVLVERAGHDAARAYDEGLEIILLPHLVPVLILCLALFIRDAYAGQGKVFDCFAQGFRIILLDLDIRLKLLLLFCRGGKFRGFGVIAARHGAQVQFAGAHKTLKTRACKHIGKHILNGLGAGIGGKGKFVVFHVFCK